MTIDRRLVWIWKPGDRKTVWLAGVLIVVAVLFLVSLVDADLESGKGYPFGDFFALWSYARIALSHPVADLYDMTRLHGAQVALGMPAIEENPFPYPPTMLLLIGWLGFMPFAAACLGWIGLTLGLFLVTLCAGLPGKPVLTVAGVLAPASACCIMFGQSGFLLAAFLVGGLRCTTVRPILAGVLFGLLTYKPQFGLMVPVALLAAGQWRTIAAACFTAVVFALAVTVLYGASSWAHWLAALPAYDSWFEHRNLGNRFIPTVLSDLQGMRVPSRLAWSGQVFASLLAAGVTWTTWRRLPAGLAAPATLAATMLASPHAFLYDEPVMVGAVLLFIVEQVRRRGWLTTAQVMCLGLVLLIPVLAAVLPLWIPASTLVTGLMLATVFRVGRGERGQALA